MTEILCKWLNQDLVLGKQFDKNSFVQDFASGYYLGEIFNKYNLQDDFGAFSQSNTATAKLNNFTRLEPTLALLQIPFNTNTAYSIMMKERGIVTRLLYQIYVALQRLEKNKLTGTAIEAMRAPAPINLDHIQTALYKERLKTIVPRETDITLNNVSDKFRERKKENDRRILEAKYIEAAEQRRAVELSRNHISERNNEIRMQRNKLMAKISAATVQIPKPVPSKTLKSMQQRKETKKKLVAISTMAEIDKFEDNLKKLLAPSANSEDQDGNNNNQQQESGMYGGDKGDAYLRKIKTRLEEDAVAREERAKRRRKVLVDQMKAHYAQEEAIRQDQIVQRLLRQSQQERRIAVQLLQIRREKDVIKNNRIFQEKQFEERRLRDYQDALEKEAELARLVQQEYAEETKREMRIHENIMDLRRKEKYRKHYNACKQIVNSFVDFAIKISDYRTLTDKNVPEKFMREWKRLVVEGFPLNPASTEEIRANRRSESDKNHVLDVQDFEEYHHLMGEWKVDEEKKSKNNNNIVFGMLLYRMFQLFQPEQPTNLAPQFPHYPVKAAILGKKFSGKTTVVRQLAANHQIIPICVEELLQDSIKFAKQLQAEQEKGAGNFGNMPLHSAGIGRNDNSYENDVFENDHNSGELLRSLENEDGKLLNKLEDLATSLDDNFEEDTLQRAQLGMMALEHLKEGRIVPDEVLVGLVVERIQRIRDGSGWILDGFPATSKQAALLELALSGRELSPEDGSVINRFEAKKSILVENPRQEQARPALNPALHVVIILDVDDKLIIKRATGRMIAETSHEEYHPEFNPPPFGSLTGVGTEQVVPLEDVAYDKEQIQNRLESYHDNAAQLEVFYRSASIVCRVDGTLEQEAVFKDAEVSLFETLEMIQQIAHHAAMVALEEARRIEELERAALEAAEKAAQPPPTPPPPVVEDEGKDSKKSNRSGRSSKKSGKSGSRRSSRKDSSKGKKHRSPSPERKSDSAPAITPEEVVGPQPGEPDYVFVENPIEPEIYKALVPLWDKSEDTYISSMKNTFKRLRAEREEILRYLYNLRVNYKEYLKRPDHKQPFIHSWQLDYNNFDEDVRCDDETKEEMHHRVDDLCERLWDICDAKKEDNEEERNNLMKLGWMDDHLCVLTNLYIMIMQCEVDRFQDSINLTRDYYSAMCGKIISEIGGAGTFLRLPLYNLNCISQCADTVITNESCATLPDSGTNETKPPKSSENPEGGGELQESNSRTKIPFIPRGSAICAQAFDAEGKASAKAKPPKSGNLEISSSVLMKQAKDVEDRMLVETNLFACNAVSTMVANFISEKEAEEEEVKKEAEPVDAGKKGGRKGSAGGKKGGKGGKKSGKNTGASHEEPLPPPPPDPMAEIKKKKLAKMKEEYLMGLRLEESRVKFRLELISERGREMLKYLKGEAAKTFDNMQRWLGEYFEQEMAAIEDLSTTIRGFIEDNEPIKYELRLDIGKCYANNEVKVIRPLPPSVRPPPVEEITFDSFTISQLYGLFNSFNEINQTGLMSSTAFKEIVKTLTSAAYDEEPFPASWKNITTSLLNEIVEMLAVDKKLTVDWRKFLLGCSAPPKPTIPELLKIRKEYLQVDVAGNGWILEEQYDAVELWFSRDINRVSSPEDRTLSYPYNRYKHLHSFYFHLFADHKQSPSRLNYINMLMYFAMDTDPIVGFFNAMAVASGKLMPKVTTCQEEVRPDEMTDPYHELSTESNTHSDEKPEAAMSSEEQLIEIAQNYKADRLTVDIVPPSLIEPHSWWLVLHYNSTQLADQTRFAKSYDHIDPYSMIKILEIYSELDSPNGSALPIQILLKHLVLQDAVLKTTRFEMKDLKLLLNPPVPEVTVSPELDLPSI